MLKGHSNLNALLAMAVMSSLAIASSLPAKEITPSPYKRKRKYVKGVDFAKQDEIEEYNSKVNTRQVRRNYTR